MTKLWKFNVKLIKSDVAFFATTSCKWKRKRPYIPKSGAQRISDTTLVALTLLIAASKPQEKDMMVKIVLNLMK